MGRKARERERERTREAASRDPGTPAVRLDSVAFHLLRRLRRDDSPEGLTGARLSALSALVTHGPLTLGSLARVEGVRPPSMTRLVAALEADGLVERLRDPHDGRRVFIHATSDGFALETDARRERVAEFASQLRDYGKRDLRTLDDAASLLESVLGRST